MQNKLTNFENELKTIVDNYEPSYSAKAWSDLDENLPKNHTKWYFLAASVLIISVAALTYKYINIDQIVDKTIEANTLVNNNVIQIESPKNSFYTSKVEHKNSQLVKESIQLQKKIKSVESVDKSTDSIISETQISKKEAAVEVVVEELEITESVEPYINKTIIEKTPQIYLNTQFGCSPLQVVFSIKDLPIGTNVNWRISDGFNTDLDHFEHTIKKEGSYKVTAVFDLSGEQIILEDSILVNESPIVDFDYEELDGSISMENKSDAYETLNWTFSNIISTEEEPTFEMLYSGIYHVSLVVKNEKSCVSTLTKSINYKVNHHIFAPNAFSPDGDGVNDAFLIKYEARDSYEYTLQIFNANGKKLFETQDQYLAWEAQNISPNSNHEKFTWRLIIKDPRSVIETYEGFFVDVSR